MKKTFILFFLCSMLANAHAQFTNTWTKPADGTGYSWFNILASPAAGFNINNVASIAYNPATDKLLVSSRNSQIYIVNPTTGVQEGTMNVTGMGTEGFKFNKIRVDATGVIYGISLVTAAGSCKIYRWATQSSAPTLCATFTVTERCGDAFGLSGTGASTVLYASGSGTATNAFNIYILNTADGSSFSLESRVTMASSLQWANRTVEPDGTGVNADIWIKGGGFNARKISVSAKDGSDVRTGTLVTTIADGTTGGQASVGYGGMRVMTVSGTKYLLFSGSNNAGTGTVMRALNITNEAAVTLYGTETLPTTYSANTNGTGDVSYKDNGNGTFNIFYLATNNGIAATAAATIPVELMKFEAKLKNQQTLLHWSTASEKDNTGFSVERSINGVDYTAIGFVKGQPFSSGIKNYEYTDATVPKATPIVYYRLKQMDNNGKYDYSPIVSVKCSSEKLALLAAYPMPITEGVTLEVVSNNSGKVTISVMDIVGRVVKTESFALIEGNNSLQLGLTQLAKGAYFLRLNTGEMTINQRIVKQ